MYEYSVLDVICTMNTALRDVYTVIQCITPNAVCLMRKKRSLDQSGFQKALDTLLRKEPNRTTIETNEGMILEGQDNPRAAFEGHVGLNSTGANSYPIASFTYLCFSPST